MRQYTLWQENNEMTIIIITSIILMTKNESSYLTITPAQQNDVSDLRTAILPILILQLRLCIAKFTNIKVHLHPLPHQVSHRISIASKWQQGRVHGLFRGCNSGIKQSKILYNAVFGSPLNILFIYVHFSIVCVHCNFLSLIQIIIIWCTKWPNLHQLIFNEKKIHAEIFDDCWLIADTNDILIKLQVTGVQLLIHSEQRML